MNKWTLNSNELMALEDLQEGLEDLENNDVYEVLCSASLCVNNDGLYVPTIAGEAVLEACMENDVDANEIESVVVKFIDDSLEEAVVEIF